MGRIFLSSPLRIFQYFWGGAFQALSISINSFWNHWLHKGWVHNRSRNTTDLGEREGDRIIRCFNNSIYFFFFFFNWRRYLEIDIPKKKILTEKLSFFWELFSDLYIKRKNLIYLTFKLYLIFESNSYHKFYFLKSFSKKLKKLLFLVSNLMKTSVKFNKNNTVL